MEDAARTPGGSAPSERAGPVPLLRLEGIVKRFPGCLANDRIDLEVTAGEIHALLGENGAGKSTLVKIIYGLLAADAGRIFWNGEAIAIASPAEARRLGIGMVFQHFTLFEALTVAENIALGLSEPAQRRDLGARIAEVSRAYGLPLDPARSVYDLSVGERQRVEVVRCLLQDCRLLIMDEPTSVLTPQESDKLFVTLRRLAAEGTAILYISHRLEEIRALCQRATILRAGRVVADCDPRQETVRRLAELTVGGALEAARSRVVPPVMPARLKVRKLSVAPDSAFGTPLKEVSFSVAGGEILGIAGVAGNGQNELIAALSGELPSADPAAVAIDEQPVGTFGPAQRRRLGAAFVPEERLGHGLVTGFSLIDNAFLTAHRRLSLVERGWIRRGKARDFAKAVIGRFDVRTSGPDAEARALSGGNLQKFAVGREILQNPAVLVVAQPTWGVDAAAAAAIHQALKTLASEGAAVVIISQDLDEILALADRVAVMFHGRLSAARPTADITVEELGLLMGGAAGNSDAA
ncbi:MAG: ABC transporter ATP-binding protein [Kiloniellales bacterium]